MPIRGLPVDRARDTRAGSVALPGGRGFGGTVDGVCLTDVLGRVPVFLDRSADEDGVDPDTPGAGWGFDPHTLVDPIVLPPGHELDLTTWSPADGLEPARRWTTLPAPDPLAPSAAVDRLDAALDAALAAAEPAPVAFSGGVDSSVLGAAVGGPLYVAGVPGSHDLAAAERAADWLDRPLERIELDPDWIESLVPTVADAIGRTNAMDVSIAVPLFAVAQQVADDGHDRLVLGQGADELFGGYDKVAKAPADPRVDADTVGGARRELVGTLPDQLERDVRAMRAAGVDPVVPYLDDRVIDAALRIPGDALVDDRVGRKRPLRLVARSFIPDAVAFEDKTAVQYGSDVADELDRLARAAGFSRSDDDHVTAYVESRTNG